MDDHPAFLAGAARLLKSRGTLLVSCGGEGNAAGIVDAMEEVIHKKLWQEYFSEFKFLTIFIQRTTMKPGCLLRGSPQPVWSLSKKI